MERKWIVVWAGLGLAVWAACAQAAESPDTGEAIPSKTNYSSAFTCSDPGLAGLWRAGLEDMRTALGTAPGYDLTGALVQAYFEGTGRALATGDASLMRDSLEAFGKALGILGGKADSKQPYTVQALLWPMVLHQYYLYSGDRDFVTHLATEGIPTLYEGLKPYVSQDHLLRGITGEGKFSENNGSGASQAQADGEDAVANALYYQSLVETSRLLGELDGSGEAYQHRADEVKTAYLTRFYNKSQGIFVAHPGDSIPSVYVSSLCAAYGLAPKEALDSIARLIETGDGQVAFSPVPFAVQASYAAGKASQAYHLMEEAGRMTAPGHAGAEAVSVIVSRLMGLKALAPGWTTVLFSPNLPMDMDQASLTICTPPGRIVAHYEKGKGFDVTLPPGITLKTDLSEEVPLHATVDKDLAERKLTPQQMAYLQQHDWTKWVGDGVGVWVSVGEQMLRVIQGDTILWQARCATAKAGTGNKAGSNKTPLGWHSVGQKLGDGAPWGQVFRARQATKEIWKPGGDTKEDLVLTRVLWLKGEEPGVNKGGDVDSHARYIYIHGTNAENLIGQPSSHGCIRLRNDDVLVAFDLIPKGAKVLITEP